MTYDDWWKSLTTEHRYDFDSEGRGYKKDAGTMMRLAWNAAVAACAKVCDDYAQRGGLNVHEEHTAKQLAEALRHNVEVSGPKRR